MPRGAFRAGAWRAVELDAGDVPRLQAFFDANPAYSLAVDADGMMADVADVVSDLLAPRVWHVGLFIVATALHGRGAAHALYAALEAWMRASGAAWIRLGVVAGNARAERFWRRVGYVETRVRAGVAMGERVNAVRVLARPASTRHAR